MTRVVDIIGMGPFVSSVVATVAAAIAAYLSLLLSLAGLGKLAGRHRLSFRGIATQGFGAFEVLAGFVITQQWIGIVPSLLTCGLFAGFVVARVRASVNKTPCGCFRSMPSFAQDVEIGTSAIWLLLTGILLVLEFVTPQPIRETSSLVIGLLYTLVLSPLLLILVIQRFRSLWGHQVQLVTVGG